ncbi:glycosyltransferase family 4 protein [Flavisolibacter nicotianae]|uniref:glycosyltransferase family 4 protein n=1 Tax=Flavisolibacter nicotianae TaxID=2364882 RepID=UPI0013C4E6F4|nr:glycosyltransferase family 4 protein [Flavisolibacter nicotianae]
MMEKSLLVEMKPQTLVAEAGKKVLVLIPDPAIPGGVSNYYKTLALDKRANIAYFPVNTAKPQGPVAAVTRLAGRYWRFFFQLLFQRYDVVVVNPSLDMGKSFHRDLVFLLIARLLKRETVVFFRGWFEPYEEVIRKSKWKQFLFRNSYAKADKHVVLGEIFKRKLLSLGVPPQTPFFVETTVADSSFVKELDLAKKRAQFEKEISFLFLSRIEKEKGIYIAIDAFVAFRKAFPERKATLQIAGDGPDLAAVKQYVETKGLADIRFLGHIDREAKKEVLLQSHILLFPSFTEGLPNSILEGMLYGMPIIARATGGIPEVVSHGANGYVTESYDPAVFTGFITEVSLNSDLYAAMAETNHKQARQKFTSEKVKERIIRIYSDTL